MKGVKKRSGMVGSLLNVSLATDGDKIDHEIDHASDYQSHGRQEIDDEIHDESDCQSEEKGDENHGESDYVNPEYELEKLSDHAQKVQQLQDLFRGKARCDLLSDTLKCL